MKTMTSKKKIAQNNKAGDPMKEKWHFAWNFPKRKILTFRGEVLILFLMSLAIYIFTCISVKNGWAYGILMVLLFAALYIGISYLINHLRKVEENYILTSNHLLVNRKTRWSRKGEKVHRKEIIGQKIDKNFHGGHIISKQGRHHLFFNNRTELEELEKWLGAKKKKK
jgi:hypothetical protein